jgi:hypothetical protein
MALHTHLSSTCLFPLRLQPAHYPVLRAPAVIYGTCQSHLVHVNIFAPPVVPPGTAAMADFMGVCSFENFLRLHDDVETSLAAAPDASADSWIGLKKWPVTAHRSKLQQQTCRQPGERMGKYDRVLTCLIWCGIALY